MPFPTAHPAAVLPLRRHCPRYLSFLGLVVGSLIPDSSYAFYSAKLAEFAHHFIGSFCYDLPVGLAAVYVFLLIRAQVLSALPARYRGLFEPLCRKRNNSWTVIAISLLIGIWTHLLLDAATHREGWLVLHLPVLAMPVGWIGGHAIRISTLLWNGCTLVGNAWVALAYLDWLNGVTGSRRFASWKIRAMYALGFAVASIPCVALHKLVTGRLALLPITGAMLVVAFFVWHTLDAAAVVIIKKDATAMPPIPYNPSRA